MGTYTFQWPSPANEVFVTGTFDDWGKTVKLDRVGDIFAKEVSLPIGEKIYYKFVVDGIWTTDKRTREENDGSNNLNNVLLPEEIQPRTQTQTQTKTSQNQATPTIPTTAMSGVTPDSTTAVLAANVPKEEPNGHLPGAFPDTPGQESEQIFSVNPIAASGGYENPVKLNPGEKVPDLSTIHGNTVESTVKLDKESYEKSDSVPLASAGTQSDTAGPSAFTLPPVSKNTVPESSLPMGGPAQRAASTELEQKQAGGPAQQAAMANPGFTIQSAHPTSTTAALAAQVPLENQTNGAPVNEVPDVVKESISEARKDPEATANKKAVEEKKEVEQELTRKVDLDESTGTPAPAGTAATTTKAPVNEVPDVVKESISEAHQEPEAAANKKAVEEKKEVEQELTKKVDLDESAGAPAPTETAATTTKAPGATNAGITASHLSTGGFDSADVSPTSSPPPGHAAPKSAPTSAPTSAPKTETKTQPTATSGDTTSSPAKQVSTGAESTHKDEKRKHRLSGFFSKLKEKLK
ncbi:Immunoglobulin E-set [Penicillium lividum]|nr:Immunoglobulin E-set [Penicillium lividum]